MPEMKLSPVSRMQSLSFPLVFFGVLSCAPVAFAAHPLITDDAGTMGAGKGQLEMNGEYVHDNSSLAIKPGLTLPIGDDDKGLGAGKATYSLFFIASQEMDPWAFHLNLGYIRNENTLDEEKDLWNAY